MTNENVSSASDNKRIPFGTRLKSAREAMGLERRDVASQLRLNEKIIMMMEKDRYPVDLPVTFIRGYLRSYAKFLQIPEYEIKKGIEPIKPKSPTPEINFTPAPSAGVITTSNYFVQFVTYLILFTLAGLVAIWWYTHHGQSGTAPAAAVSQAAENTDQSVVGNEESINSDDGSDNPVVSPDLTVNEDQQQLSEQNIGQIESQTKNPPAARDNPGTAAKPGKTEPAASTPAPVKPAKASPAKPAAAEVKPAATRPAAAKPAPADTSNSDDTD